MNPTARRSRTLRWWSSTAAAGGPSEQTRELADTVRVFKLAGALAAF